MVQLTTAVIAGSFSLVVAFVTLYRGVPEKRVLELQDILKSQWLTDEHRKTVEGAIERQVIRLAAPDYSKWFLRWAASGTLLSLVAAFFVGLFADDRGKAIFYVVYPADSRSVRTAAVG
ncbi:hypothetical protein O4162_14630 [Dietzia maris]|uniref:hypothetical protein n=1 Tax=Dietzia maris TaxID=37915 RepID=UPI0022B480E1|nr:hypothetical protein [Dietzia maris]MCZ4541382.1 hypothetical protein [Dietzia maris]